MNATRVACLLFENPTPTEKIAELLLRFSPQISLRAKQAVFIEVGRCGQLYSESSFAARATVLLKKWGQNPQITFGADVTDSLCKNLYGKDMVDELPLLSLAEFADPFLQAPQQREQTEKIVHAFRDLGVHTVGQFLKIPSADLSSRFGALGTWLWRRTQMLDSPLWPRWTPTEVMFEKVHFPYFEFYGELEPILFELKKPLELLFARARARQKKVLHLQLKLFCEQSLGSKNAPRVFDFPFFTPQSTTKPVFKIIYERLKNELNSRPLHLPAQAVELTLLKTEDATDIQRNLFSNPEERTERLNGLHQQLVELLGKENVFSAHLLEDRRPEKSWRRHHGQPHSKQDMEHKLSLRVPFRPTYLCPKPIPVEITAGYLHIFRRRHRILHWSPEFEHIAGGWYENPTTTFQNTFDRVYSLVTLEGHQKILVFETPERQFFLHGYEA